MAVTSIMTSEEAIDAKAGANASASFTDGMKTVSVSQGESFVNNFCRTNYSDSFSSLDVGKKFILNDIVSSFVAMNWIAYDMDGIGRREAESRINLLRDTMLRALSVLRDKEFRRFVDAS